MEPHHAQFDVSQITEFVFLGTNLCCLTRSHIQILFDIGVTAEIDLESERQQPVPEIPVYMWLPVPDKTAPTVEQFDAGVSLIKSMVTDKKKVYVHCKYGHGRSPTMVAAYLIKEGKSVDEAIELIKSSRPEVHIEEGQKAALEKYSEKLV